MLNAVYFTYNGVFSAKYGLKISSLDGEASTQTITRYSPTISTTKSKNMKRFYISNEDIGETPEFEFTITSDVFISNIVKRDVVSWLSSGVGFEKLIIHKPEAEEFYYLCKFTNIREMQVSGQCVGFKITALFDSPYQYGKDTILTIPEGEYVDAKFTILNKSEFDDDYVYPQLEFTINSNNTLSIVTDSEGNREFYFTGLEDGTTVSVDNELKIIDGTTIDLFNKNWLRLKKGKNELTVTFNGSMTIRCPQIVNIGF